MIWYAHLIGHFCTYSYLAGRYINTNPRLNHVETGAGGAFVAESFFWGPAHRIYGLVAWIEELDPVAELNETLGCGAGRVVGTHPIALAREIVKRAVVGNANRFALGIGDFACKRHDVAYSGKVIVDKTLKRAPRNLGDRGLTRIPTTHLRAIGTYNVGKLVLLEPDHIAQCSEICGRVLKAVESVFHPSESPTS